MRKLFGIVVLGLVSFSSVAAIGEGDPVVGQQKAYTCQFCHGVTGYSPNKSYPHINGQNELYLYNAMKAYQAGERTGPLGNMMRQQMSVLSDQDMKDIAAYYASQAPGEPE